MVKLMNWLHGSWILEQPASSLMTKHPAAPAAVDPDQTYKINAFFGIVQTLVSQADLVLFQQVLLAAFWFLKRTPTCA